MERLKNAGKTTFWVIVLTLLLSGQSLLITYSQKGEGYTYSTTSAILLAEIVKFLIVIGLM